MNFRLIHADVIDGLKQLGDESVQCAITSPPYWGLRDYGVVGQLGLERTPDEYVATMVAVFAEVWRVLRSDGTLWLNIGDSYNAYNANRGPAAGANKNHHEIMPAADRGLTVPFLKNKDLVGIPWMLAFALRAAGWYLRSDIIWSKPNPMPESVTDRPTKAHEYLFLLTKSARYYYDADAIREPATYPDGPNSPESIASPYGQGFTRRAAGPNSRENVDRVPRSRKDPRHGRRSDEFRGDDPMRNSDAERFGTTRGKTNESCTHPLGRNKRSVWTIATEPFPEAHFATFPTKLVEPCILAGSRVGDTILDPFNGSGTTGVVALSHQRDYVGIELNADYLAMARRRLEKVAPMFAREVTA